MAQQDEIDVPKLAVIGTIGAILVIAIIVFVQALFYKTQGELNDQHNLPQNRALRTYQVEQQEKLHHYGWADQPNKITTLPIEQAMSLTVRDLATARDQAMQAQNTPPPAGQNLPKPAPKGPQPN